MISGWANGSHSPKCDCAIGYLVSNEFQKRICKNPENIVYSMGERVGMMATLHIMRMSEGHKEDEIIGYYIYIYILLKLGTGGPLKFFFVFKL